MAKKAGLLKQLDAHKGRDYEAEKKKKELKAGEKRKRDKLETAEASESEVDEDVEEKATKKSKKGKTSNGSKVTIVDAVDEAEASDALDASADEEALTTNGTIPQPPGDVDASASEADPESDVPFSDLEEEDLEDAIPHQRLTINNGPALLSSTKRVTIAKPSMPFHYHNSLISLLPPSSTAIPDANDDLTRELEFYRIARDGVVSARTKLKKEKVPFTRPTDYFAEMAKSEDHMGKIKKKMYDEAAGKKASQEARKLRDAKKFGKAVQVAKEQERAKEKKVMLDNVKELKRKRKGQAPTSTVEPDDLFQEIAVENDGAKRDRSSSSRGGRGGRGDGDSSKRQKRDSKYGFGGKKRFAKSGDAISSSDLSGFSARGMKSGGRGGGASRGGRAGRGGRGGGSSRGSAPRPGKSKRASGRS